jgi:AcrR family transcriptional regulator
MSPRQSIEQQRHDEVLDATWQLIAEVGYGRVRIADIAKRVGTSTGTIHYHFDTKEDVLDAAFRYAVADARRRSEAALAKLDDPWERLVALLEAHMPRADLIKEWLIWLQLWNEASVRPELRSLNETHYGRWIDFVESIVLDGQERGTFRRLDAREFVMRLLAMMDGMAIQVTMGSSEFNVERVRNLLLGFAREQLLPAS